MNKESNQTEAISPLAAQDINLLHEDKSGILAIVVLFSIGLIICLVIAFLLYKEAPDSFWILAVFGFLGLGIYLTVAFFGVLRIMKVNKEIKKGIKKTKTVILEDYEALTSSTSTSTHVANPTSFYFKAGGETYKVSRSQYYNFLNGDLVKITFSPILKIVLGIEKAEENPRLSDQNEQTFPKRNK